MEKEKVGEVIVLHSLSIVLGDTIIAVYTKN